MVQSHTRFGGYAIRVSFCLVMWLLTAGSQTGLCQNAQSARATQILLPTFDAASVRLTPKELTSEISVRKCENGRLTMRKLSLVAIVSWAFDVSSWDIVVPGWAEPRLGVPTYDINAVADGPVPDQQVKLMLQRLLAERFQFAAHHEMREGVHRVLRVAKGGPKLRESGTIEPGTPAMRNDQANSRLIYKGASVAGLVANLNLTGIGEPIYDRTGLTGRYDFTLDYGKYLQDSEPDHRLNALTAARIDALRDLGLEVVDARITVDTLVVDHAEKIPAEN